MPSKLLAAVSAAALLVPALPASAISVSLVENSATRFAFDVVWGDLPSVPLSVIVDDAITASFVLASDHSGYIELLFASDVFGVDTFRVLFSQTGSLGRAFESNDVLAFDGAEFSALPWNSYGARFVYGEGFPVDPPTGVPDNGASALLLSAGLAGLTLLRRTVV